MKDSSPQSRRDFLVQSALLAGAAASMGRLAAAESVEKPKPFRIAMINSEYRFKSHAYHFGRRFMEGYVREGFHHQPAQTVVRMFNDKHPANDLSGADAARFHFERAKGPVHAIDNQMPGAKCTEWPFFPDECQQLELLFSLFRRKKWNHT